MNWFLCLLLKQRILSRTGKIGSGKSTKYFFSLLGMRYTLRTCFKSRYFSSNSCPELSSLPNLQKKMKKYFLGGIFLVEFFGGFFWEDFLGRIFLGGFFGRIIGRNFLEEFFFYIGIDLFVKILSKSKASSQLFLPHSWFLEH